MIGTRLVNKGRRSLQTSGTPGLGRVDKDLLPSPHAMQRLTGGRLGDRTINDYAKATPTGLAAPGAEADLMHLGLLGPKIQP